MSAERRRIWRISIKKKTKKVEQKRKGRISRNLWEKDDEDEEKQGKKRRNGWRIWRSRGKRSDVKEEQEEKEKCIELEFEDINFQVEKEDEG